MIWRSESGGKGLGWLSSRSAAFCLALAALVTAGFAVAGLIVRPNMYSDSGWGFLGWYAQAPTLPFNHAMALDPSDIARSVDAFMATWTPGQHMLPGLLERLGLDLGQAIVLVVAIFSALGLGGWFVLYRALGFPSSSAALTVLIVACSRFYGQPFTNYNGGEVLLFGTAPWFLLLVWSLRRLGWFAVIPFLAGTAVLVFMKLTGIVVCAAAVGAAAICGDEAWRRRETIRKLMVAGVTIGLMAGIFYYAWYVRGVTAASISSAVHQDGAAFYVAFVLVSLWSASFSLLDLASYLLLNPGWPVLETIDLVVYLLLPLALAAFAVTWMRLHRGHGEYLRFAVAVAGAMAALFLLMWLSGKSISVEERHLRIPSLLLLGGMVHAFVSGRRPALLLPFAAVAILSSLYGLASFVARAEANTRYALGDRGFRHMVASSEAIAFIRKIDVPGPDAQKTLLFMPSPEMALEARQARSWSNHADFEPLEDLRAATYRGRVDRLYVFLQKRLVANGKADAVLKSFVDYPIDGWTEVSLGDIVCFYQIRKP